MERRRITWHNYEGEFRWAWDVAALGRYGWAPNFNTDYCEQLYLFPDGSWVLECADLRPGDYDLGEEEWEWDITTKPLTDGEAFAWLVKRGKLPAMKDWPPELVALAEKYNAARPASAPCHKPEGESPSARVENVPAKNVEDALSRFLAGSPAGTLEEAIAATGLSENRIRQAQAWKAHEARKLAAFLANNPDATTVDAAGFMRCSAPKIVGMHAWKTHKEQKQERRAAHRQKCFEKRQRQAKAKYLPAPTPVDPDERSASAVRAARSLFQGVWDWSEPHEQRRLNALSQDGRRELVRHLQEECDHEALEKMEPDRKREIVKVVVESWLDAHEDREREAKAA